MRFHSKSTLLLCLLTKVTCVTRSYNEIDFKTLKYLHSPPLLNYNTGCTIPSLGKKIQVLCSGFLFWGGVMGL